MDSPKEINKRVAEACGWSGLENADACISEMFPYPDKHLNLAQLVEATASGWFGWAPGAPGPSTVGGFISEGADKEPTPDYCRDASAADLVIQEIERRGWGIGADEYVDSDDGQRIREWSVGVPGNPTGKSYYGRNDDSWKMALCLAFLAAHDASKEAGQ